MNQTQISLIFTLTILFGISLGTSKSFTWDYPSYSEYIKNTKENKSSKGKYNFCSFVFNGRVHGASDCYIKANNEAHIKTCGTKGEWCKIPIEKYSVKNTHNQSLCNGGSQRYDQVSVLRYIVKMSEDKNKKSLTGYLPDCIKGDYKSIN